MKNLLTVLMALVLMVSASVSYAGGGCSKGNDSEGQGKSGQCQMCKCTKGDSGNNKEESKNVQPMCSKSDDSDSGSCKK